MPLPRRMWAGSRLDFPRPLALGDAVDAHSTIARRDVKTGRSRRAGVRHRAPRDRRRRPALALVEEQDIVYRDRPQPGAAAPPPQAAPADAACRATHRARPDVLLFRYSALTFNGHRIHYDRRYVTGVEGYPG